MPKSASPAIFLFFLLLQGPFCAAVAEEPSLLKTDVEFLCGKSCNGRESARAGAFIAAQYIAGSLKSTGLETAVTSRQVPGRAEAVHNVVARTSAPGRPVLVLARYDGLGAASDSTWYPGADSNAGGVAALLELARRFSASSLPIVFVAVDAMSIGNAGAEAVWQDARKYNPRMVVTLDILGSSLAPVKVSWPHYLIALGGSRYASGLETAGEPVRVHLFYDYYGSERFTRYFFVEKAPHRKFLEAGFPCVLFTSGITDHTNKLSDTPSNLDWDMLSRRIDLIFSWISRL